jgi:hypothetical protein
MVTDGVVRGTAVCTRVILHAGVEAGVYETGPLPLGLEELQQHGVCVQPLGHRLGHLP